MTLPGTKENGPRSLTELALAIQHRTGSSQEEDYAAASKIYRHYVSNEWGMKFARSNGIENPWWNRLQKEDQERIMEEINNDQPSRKATAGHEDQNEKNATHSDTDNAPFTTPSNQQPICHGPQA